MAEELLKNEEAEQDELLEDDTQKGKFMTFQTGTPNTEANSRPK